MIKVGEPLPEGSFRVKNDDGSVSEVSVAELFGGRKVVFVGVPGAFTSTCHNAHIPQFVANADLMKSKGVDRIVVMAVNDHHVMKTWGESFGVAGRIDFVSDGDANYARALGLATPMVGMGVRVRRFSALVEDGVVKTLNFEPPGGKGIQATGAATMLEQISPGR
ncbi:MAG: peroxiredoxin [Bauldia sp.]